MSQLGDLGRPMRAMKRTNASMVLVPMTRRQGVPASCRSVPMMNAIMKPTYQAIRVSPSNRPRSFGGENSDSNGPPIEYSPPIATPMKNRMAASWITAPSPEVTKNWAPEATRNRPMSTMNMGFRPNLSVAQPASGEPMKIPASGPAAIMPSDRASSWRSDRMDPVTGPMIPRM